MLLTIIVFAIILGLLILVHEIGHFVTAKRAGVKVEEFGLGYPPRIFGIKKGETIYSLNLFPIGGFVKIAGENGPESDKRKTENKRVFYNQSVGKRAIILTAGVAMNFLLACLLLGIGHWIGLPSIVDDEMGANLKDAKVQFVQVASDSPASRAGISIGDSIKEFRISNSEFRIDTVSQMQGLISEHKGEEITLVIERGDEILEKTLIPRINPPANQGPLGVALAKTAIVSYPWHQALIKGIVSTVSLTWMITIAFGNLLWQLITTGHLTAEIAGPVGIFDFTAQATQLGFIYLLQLTALLSINLAIINILPFPALDGGRLLFLAIEKIKGSPVSQRIEGFTHTVGFVLLILLMLAVTWRDIIRLF
jgi:regulator of sigma E protease